MRSVSDRTIALLEIYAADYLYPLSAFGIGLFLVVIGITIRPEVAIKGSYTLIGVLLAVVFYKLLISGHSETKRKSPPSHRYLKLVFVIIFLSLGVVALTGKRWYVLLIALPVGYALFGIQLYYEYNPSVLLPQIGGLYLLNPVTKVLSTYYYFGSGDIIINAKNIQDLLSAGSITAIRLRYQPFPVLHVLTGETALLTGTSAYSALMILGIAVYAVFTVVVISTLGREVFGEPRLGVYLSLIVTMMAPISYYATFFHPQALAMVLAILVVLLATLQHQRRDTVRFGLIGFVLIGVLVGTHHLTIVLFAPVVFLIVLSGQILELDNLSKQISYPRIIPVVIVLMAAVSYWVFVWKKFIVGLLSAVLTIFVSDPSGGSSIPLVLYTHGRPVLRSPLISALADLFQPQGLQLIVLFALFMLSLRLILERIRELSSVLPWLTTGLISALFVFKTPLSFRGIGRLRVVLIFFFAMIPIFGFKSLFNRYQNSTIMSLVPVLLIVILGTTSGILAADDVQNINGGAVNKQHSISYQEHMQLRETAKFIRQKATDRPNAFLRSSVLFGRLYQTQAGGGIRVTRNQMLVTSGLLVYDESWKEYAIQWRKSNGAIVSIVASDRWVENLKGDHNKVHTTGGNGLLWSDSTYNTTI